MHDDNMATTAEGIYVAGDITGVEEASSAMEEGKLAGIAAAAKLGYLGKDEAEKLKNEVQVRLSALRTGIFGEKRQKAKTEQMGRMEAYLKEKGANA